MMDEADLLLAGAAKLGATGRFQLEAAIQSVHARRAVTGSTDWEAISLLYEGVVRYAPTIGSLVGRAGAVGEAHGALAGLNLLDRIPAGSIQIYQPYWALRAHFYKRLGQIEEARTAFGRAIGLCEDEAMRAFLIKGMP
jgi:RNA polymerase sigma-70 factor (ECF subfamily)